MLSTYCHFAICGGLCAEMEDVEKLGTASK